jgi:hypothetical protein
MKLPIVLNEPPNIFDAEIVHQGLNENLELWNRVVYVYQTVGVYGTEGCEVDHINYYLLANPGMEDRLIDLASRWKPGRLEWVSWEESRGFGIFRTEQPIHKQKILKVIWVV